MMGHISTTLLAICFLAKYAESISDETRLLVTKWAPRVWLHPEEPFYPSTVDFYLENMQVRNGEEGVEQPSPLAPDTLATGEETAGWHLNTVKDMECVNCFEDFFSGQPQDQVPSYTFVTEHKDSCNTVDVTYTLFYPFNYGKDVCLGIESGSSCVGSWRTFGNHVGDWEHVSLRLQGGQPTKIYVGVHSFGAWYDWVPAEEKFVFVEGEPMFQKTFREGKFINEIKLDVEYPQELLLEEGHPAVFSANGSHGVWAEEGKHTYLHILTVHLDDWCSRGQAWDTWNYLEIYETGEWDSFSGNETWVDFRGDWGNVEKMGCEFEPIVGECGLVGGPSGPHKYFQHDFPQPPPCGQN
eukprot:GFUD01019140.1.p1 GENE.GFUD01019140.1~~GFUD01019140.1.p1  ORF type:complete len:354 (+),score=85.06 GFUD01019140.1:245-1306(+)